MGERKRYITVKVVVSYLVLIAIAVYAFSYIYNVVRRTWRYEACYLLTQSLHLYGLAVHRDGVVCTNLERQCVLTTHLHSVRLIFFVIVSVRQLSYQSTVDVHRGRDEEEGQQHERYVGC